MPHLAVDRHEDIRANPAIERFKLGAAGMAGHMNHALPVGHHRDPARCQLVLYRSDADLVARDLAAREQHHITAHKFERVVFVGDPGQGRALFALPPGRKYQQIAARQAHCSIEIDRVGEVGQIAIRLRHLDDPVEGAPGHADLPAGLARHIAEGLQPCDIAGKGRHQHALTVVALNLFEQTFVDRSFGLARRGIEDIRAVAHQRQHALVADLRQLFS